MKTQIFLVIKQALTEVKVTFATQLKYLSKFWRTLDMPSINFKVSLSSTPDANPRIGINNLRDATFKIADTKLYVPVSTLSPQDDN